jgi:hypothetical protein
MNAIWVWSIGGFFMKGGKPKYSEESLFQCRFVHLKPNTEWPAIETPSPRKDVKD